MHTIHSFIKASVLTTSVVLSAIGLQTTSMAQTIPPSASEQRSQVGLWVLLNAKTGQEQRVIDFLKSGKSIVKQEPQTNTWYAVRLSKTQFAIFDTFPDEAGRSAHLSGKVAAALMAQAPELLSDAPSIQSIDILAASLPR